MLPVAYAPRLALATARLPAVSVARACTGLAAVSFFLLVPFRVADLVPVAALAVPFAFFHAGAVLSAVALATRRRQGAFTLLLVNLAPVAVFWLAVGSLGALAAGV